MCETTLEESFQNVHTTCWGKFFLVGHPQEERATLSAGVWRVKWGLQKRGQGLGRARGVTEPPGLANSRLPHGQAWAGWLRERGEPTVSPSRGEHTWTSLSCRPQVPWPNSTGAGGPGSPQTSAPTAASSREQAGLGGGVRGAPDPAPSLGPELSFRTLPHLPLLPRQAPLATRARPSPSIQMTLTRHTRSAQGLRQKAEPPPSSAHPRAHVKGTLFLLPVTSVFLNNRLTPFTLDFSIPDNNRLPKR